MHFFVTVLLPSQSSIHEEQAEYQRVMMPKSVSALRSAVKGARRG